MITEATSEQWEKIEQLKQKWLTVEQTKQATHAEVIKAVHDTGLVNGLVFLVDSPRQAQQWSAALSTIMKKEPCKLQFYCGQWWTYRDGWWHGAKILGVNFDEKLDKIHTFCSVCPVWMYDDYFVYVLKKPDEIHWQDGELHNESGPAVKYSDSFALWSIRGVAVDEQIVMQPHTQTIEQIDADENAERRRIRIERFGWHAYLDQKGATVVDERTNEVEQTYESLLTTDEMRALLCSCPSTGRVYALEVPLDTPSCEAAQFYLRGGLKVNMIGGN